MEGFDDSPTYYLEKKWYKTSGSEESVTGYSLRGGQRLKNAVIGLRETLKRSVKKTLNETHIRVVDTRKNGVAWDIEIEIMLKLERGYAMVKLYGPYDQKDKKDNVIMVTKNKRSHVKFVEILAEKVIKPLITEFVKEEIEEEEKEEDKNTCSVCGRTFKSPAGLKTHTTIKHRTMDTIPEGLVLEKEALKVVNSIENRIEELDDEEANTLNEACDIDIESKDIKQYSENCQNCGFEVTAEKKYLVCQLLNKHKKQKHAKSCGECEFKAQSLDELKRHGRDAHGEITSSTSPPAKKKRKCAEVVKEVLEDMETDENVSNLDESEMDKMDVDIVEQSDKMKRELSEKMDMKVKEKQRRIDENEKEWEEEKLEKEKKKKDLEEGINQGKKKSKKMNKQRSKNKRKQMNRKQKVGSKNKMSKIKDVPLNCRELVNEGDKVYVVPGNGACAPNSAAAHLFHDENLGPTLRIKMNKFLAANYDNYKDIFPCSDKEPFIRQLKGELKIFKDPRELKEFLQSSQEAGYMWSDSEDLKLISDLFQIKIKIITTKGPADKNPTVNWITPDKNMNEVAELKDVEIADMVLLHENDNHFDLIVPGNSELIKYGGLSDRDDIVQKNSDNENEIIEKLERAQNSDIDLKLEIGSLKKKNELYLKQYRDCETELRNKTEEVERLKTRLKDLEQKMSLEMEIRVDEDLDTSVNIEDIAKMKNSGFRRNGPNTESSPIKTGRKFSTLYSEDKKYDCKDCDYLFGNKRELNEHISWKHKNENLNCIKCEYQCSTVEDMQKHKRNHDEEFNCYDCGYQGNSQELLEKHIRFTHTMDKYKCVKCKYQGSGGEDLYEHIKNEHAGDGSNKHIEKKHRFEASVECKSCGTEFGSKPKLMNHRKLEHTKIVATCTKFLAGECSKGPDLCWWIHREVEELDIECFFCDKKFNTKGQVMVHRKKEHPKTVKSCRLVQDKNCPYDNETCWFKHENQKENSSNSVFRDGKRNVKDT